MLQLKFSPEFKAMLQLQVRPPVRLKVLRENLKKGKEKNPFAEIRRQKILDCAKRQERRTPEEKEQDFQDIQIDEFQNWVEARIRGPASSWQRWDGMIEEWEPWIFGEPVNIWRYRKL